MQPKLNMATSLINQRHQKLQVAIQDKLPKAYIPQPSTILLRNTVVKMAMTLDQARQAIITRAMAFTGIEQNRIQYPNGPLISIPVDGLWCDLNILWGSSIIAGVGDTPCTRRTGLFQLIALQDLKQMRLI